MLRLSGKSESFDFEISTAAYQKYVATRGSRWPEQERLGRSPALQHVGLTAAESTLDGVIYPGVNGKAGGSMEEGLYKLRRLSLSKEPFQLTTGMGDVCGYWSVVEVSDTRSFFLDDGQARKVEFSLKMRFYGADYKGGGRGGAASVAVPPKSTTGIQGSFSSASSLIDALPSITGNATLAEITAMANATGTLVGNAVSLASEIAYYINNPLSTLGLVGGSLADHFLPLEILSGIGGVAATAQAILSVGEQTLDTISAVTALPYTLAASTTEAGQQRMQDIAVTLRQDLVYMRDTALTQGYGTDVVRQHMLSTGRTLERVPQRQIAASICFDAATQADKASKLCRGLSADCSHLLEKFR